MQPQPRDIMPSETLGERPLPTALAGGHPRGPSYIDNSKILPWRIHCLALRCQDSFDLLTFFSSTRLLTAGEPSVLGTPLVNTARAEPTAWVLGPSSR